MALFKVNTGCRDGEVCNLHWNWEVPVPHLDTSVFLIPGDYVKNRQVRLVVLNRIAAQVIDGQRGVHPTHVFTFNGKPVRAMNNSSWRQARGKANIPDMRARFHDLRHTCLSNLGARGASTWDLVHIAGHSDPRMTKKYTHPVDERMRALVGTLDR